MHPDLEPYFRLTGKPRFDKAVNTLLGLIEGISVDEIINPTELAYLATWLDDHKHLEHRHPYTELVPPIRAAIQDHVLTAEEKADIVWLCERLRSTEYYCAVTADLQRLHAVLGGVAADNAVTAAELDGVIGWLDAHQHLRRCWPYDEIESVITSVMTDRKIDSREHKLLLQFFNNFASILDSQTIVDPAVEIDGKLAGVCAVAPEIEFANKRFCLTGTSAKFSRSEFTQRLHKHGATVKDSVTVDLDYLVVGAEGNPCWAYACYGRKVERAVELRRSGSQLLIVHEIDVRDAMLGLD